MALEVGQLVTPSLRIVQRLGAGGMGSVWIADHLTLQTQVVVKIMSPELANNAEAVARFKAEASAAANVKSPHVVQMLDHGLAEDGSPYIVMELLEGADLRSFIRARSLNRKQIVSVVLQVAKALGKAHESGVIHRDIKPGNIFLCTGDGDYFVKILDFGIAKSSFGSVGDGAHTQTGMMIGSPPFMSPEQLRGDKALDHRADLWSLAVVLFQGLTGKRPFQGDSVAELAVAIHTPPPPRPSALDPSLPPELDAWFAKAFAQRPDDRFQSARELADALEEAMSGVPTGSAMGPVPSDYGTARSATAVPKADRRWPAVVVVGAVLAVLGVGGVMKLGPRGGAAAASSAPMPATAPLPLPTPTASAPTASSTASAEPPAQPTAPATPAESASAAKVAPRSPSTAAPKGPGRDAGKATAPPPTDFDIK